MAGLPTQQHVMHSMVKAANELGGLRAQLLRLMTDVGEGIDVNAGFGRPLAGKRWEIDRILARGQLPGETGEAHVRLDRPACTSGTVAADACRLLIHLTPGKPPILVPIAELPYALPVRVGPSEVLVTLEIDLSRQDFPGEYLKGTLYLDLKVKLETSAETTVATRYDLQFWIPS